MLPCCKGLDRRRLRLTRGYSPEPGLLVNGVFTKHQVAMPDFDPERFTLRQTTQARDDFAQIMDELNFVKQLARSRRAGIKRSHRFA
jgi:hypothetical protein